MHRGRSRGAQGSAADSPGRVPARVSCRCLHIPLPHPKRRPAGFRLSPKIAARPKCFRTRPFNAPRPGGRDLVAAYRSEGRRCIRRRHPGAWAAYLCGLISVAFGILVVACGRAARGRAADVPQSCCSAIGSAEGEWACSPLA